MGEKIHCFASFLLEYMTEMGDEVDDELVGDIKLKLEETLGKTEFQRQVSQVSQRRESIKMDDSPIKRQDSTSSGEKIPVKRYVSTPAKQLEQSDLSKAT
jgi:hypothetical protein